MTFFFKKWANPSPFFVYFRNFLITISIVQIEKSIDSVLGIRTWDRGIVGADETTELWWPRMTFFANNLFSLHWGCQGQYKTFINFTDTRLRNDKRIRLSKKYLIQCSNCIAKYSIFFASLGVGNTKHL